MGLLGWLISLGIVFVISGFMWIYMGKTEKRTAQFRMYTGTVCVITAVACLTVGLIILGGKKDNEADYVHSTIDISTAVKLALDTEENQTVSLNGVDYVVYERDVLVLDKIVAFNDWLLSGGIENPFNLSEEDLLTVQQNVAILKSNDIVKLEVIGVFPYTQQSPDSYIFYLKGSKADFNLVYFNSVIDITRKNTLLSNVKPLLTVDVNMDDWEKEESGLGEIYTVYGETAAKYGTFELTSLFHSLGNLEKINKEESDEYFTIPLWGIALDKEWGNSIRGLDWLYSDITFDQRLHDSYSFPSLVFNDILEAYLNVYMSTEAGITDDGLVLSLYGEKLSDFVNLDVNGLKVTYYNDICTEGESSYRLTTIFFNLPDYNEGVRCVIMVVTDVNDLIAVETLVNNIMTSCRVYSLK